MLMLCRFFSAVFLFHFSFGMQAQSGVTTYARQVIDTLCSPTLLGRGYIGKGDSLAADYIAGEFQRMGLLALSNHYTQRFSFPVNTFPQEPILTSGKRSYKAGTEFIPDGSCGSAKGKYKVRIIRASPDGYKKGAAAFLDSVERIFGKRDALIIPDKKLNANLSPVFSRIPILHIPDSIVGTLGRKVRISIENAYLPEYRSQNVMAMVKGTTYPDSMIVFIAHYDHLGALGKKVYFPGANDNASGCAMVLTLADYFSKHPPAFSVVFIAFGGEETGLLGSRYFTQHPPFPLKKIRFLFNLDILGTGDEGIKVVNATQFPDDFDDLVRLNRKDSLLPAVLPRGKAFISDHAFFTEAGVPSFYIYTLGGIKAYHDVFDRPETLPLTKFGELYQLLIAFTENLQKEK